MSNSSTSNVFQKSTNPHSHRKKAPPPFSIRFTDEERARLQRDAGALSLAAYMRLKLFNDGAPDGSRRNKSRKARTPSIEIAMISRLLGGSDNPVCPPISTRSPRPPIRALCLFRRNWRLSYRKLAQTLPRCALN